MAKAKKNQTVIENKNEVAVTAAPANAETVKPAMQVQAVPVSDVALNCLPGVQIASIPVVKGIPELPLPVWLRGNKDGKGNWVQGFAELYVKACAAEKHAIEAKAEMDEKIRPDMESARIAVCRGRETFFPSARFMPQPSPARFMDPEEGRSRPAIGD